MKHQLAHLGSKTHSYFVTAIGMRHRDFPAEENFVYGVYKYINICIKFRKNIRLVSHLIVFLPKFLILITGIFEMSVFKLITMTYMYCKYCSVVSSRKTVF